MQDVVLPVPTFYEMSSFVPLSMRTIEREKSSFQVLDLCKSARYRRQMLSYFDTVGFARFGRIEGEYALIGDCNILVSREGAVIKSSSIWENSFSARSIDELCSSELFAGAIENILESWDILPILESPAILSDVFLENYFHFSLEMLPRIRHFAAASVEKVVLAENTVRRPFQTSLLSRASAGCSFVRAPQCLRVRNPIVAHESLSREGLHWLRQIGPRAKRGGRRLYIRRGSSSTRTLSGGGIEETVEILDLLMAHNFEIIEFGHEKTVDAQVAMLDGAGVILAAHGAALTNLAYLEEGISVIEIIGALTPRAFFMHICGVLSLQYYGILTDAYSDSGNMLIDAAILQKCILGMA